MEPFGGAGVLWLPDNTTESKKHALEVVYQSPKPKKRKKTR